jgi:hypothetical protein
MCETHDHSNDTLGSKPQRHEERCAEKQQAEFRQARQQLRKEDNGASADHRTKGESCASDDDGKQKQHTIARR